MTAASGSSEEEKPVIPQTTADSGSYPRVLIVLMTKIRAEDPGNLLIRTQFGLWPRECLAQIHATADSGGRGDFCGHYYRIQRKDRCLGRLFERLRAGVFGMVAMQTARGTEGARPARRPARWWAVAQKRVGDWLVNSGFWEILFRLRLSADVEKFVERFKPDAIYCQGYSLGFATLPLLISRRFRIPICFQTTDDWPRSLYRLSPVGVALRRRARDLIQASRVRFAFGEKMRETFERRYGVPFEVSYHLDDPGRFPAAARPTNLVPTIVYVGSLGHRRYEAILDLSAAVSALAPRLGQIRIRVLCDGIPRDAPADLRKAPHLDFQPMPAHDDLPGILAGTNVLFLPESFTEHRAAIELSISTKAHLYMASRRPIIVYGPAYSGVVTYAASEGWGIVVTSRDRAQLMAGLEQALSATAQVQQCVARAQACFHRNHDLAGGRNRFRQMLVDAVRTPRAHGSRKW